MAAKILIPLACILIAFVFGSIPNSLIIGKIYFNQDPRDYGSKNPGSTNSARIWGAKAGALVLTLDILKAVAPFWTIWAILTYSSLNTYLTPDLYSWCIWLVPLFSVIGHCYSPFLKFNGGKGVATYVGIYGSTSVLQFGCGLISFFATALKTKYVSLSSIILCSCATIISWILFSVNYFGYTDLVGYMMMANVLPMSIAYPISMTVSSLIVILRHMPNIKRLLTHTENKFSLKK